MTRGFSTGFLTLLVIFLAVLYLFLNYDNLIPSVQTPLPIVPQPSVPSQTPTPAYVTILQTKSVNWAGYVVETNFENPQNDSITSVASSWNIPTSDCTSVRNYFAAFWIGIDGFQSKSVEQIGTDSDCFQGQPQYYAWYEMYPDADVSLNIILNPGDIIRASVEYIGNDNFNLTIADLNTTDRVSSMVKSTIANRDSAEWIAEAPSVGNRILPLASFGTVAFDGAYVTVNGVRGPIYNEKWQFKKIVMESTNGMLGDPDRHCR